MNGEDCDDEFSDDSPADEGQSRAAERGDSDNDTTVIVEIEVPTTPQYSISDVSDTPASHLSSSLFESPFQAPKSPSLYYGIEHGTPTTPGIGIAKPSYRYAGMVKSP